MTENTLGPGPRGHGGWRRTVAIIALVTGLGLSWWQSTRAAHDVTASFLLTHISTGISDAEDGRQRLRRLDILVARAEGSDEIGWSHSLSFRSGAAPKATRALEMQVPDGVSQLKVRCAFELSPAGQLHESTGTAKFDPDRSDLQVIDVGRCR